MGGSGHVRHVSGVILWTIMVLLASV